MLVTVRSCLSSVLSPDFQNIPAKLPLFLAFLLFLLIEDVLLTESILLNNSNCLRKYHFAPLWLKIPRLSHWVLVNLYPYCEFRISISSGCALKYVPHKSYSYSSSSSSKMVSKITAEAITSSSNLARVSSSSSS